VNKRYLHFHGTSSISLYDHILTPVVKEVLNITDAANVGLVVACGHSAKSFGEALGKCQKVFLLQVSQSQLKESLFK